VSYFEPPFWRCPLFYARDVGSSLFSCDGCMAILVLVGHPVCSSVAKYCTYCTVLSGHYLGTEHRGRVVGPLVLCAGDPGFKSGPRDRLSWLRSFVIHFIPSRQIPRMVLRSLTISWMLYQVCYWPVVPSFDAVLLSIWKREEQLLNEARMWINKYIDRFWIISQFGEKSLNNQ
jgi:hypothetical protein